MPLCYAENVSLLLFLCATFYSDSGGHCYPRCQKRWGDVYTELGGKCIQPPCLRPLTLFFKNEGAKIGSHTDAHREGLDKHALAYSRPEGPRGHTCNESLIPGSAGPGQQGAGYRGRTQRAGVIPCACSSRTGDTGRDGKRTGGRLGGDPCKGHERVLGVEMLPFLGVLTWMSALVRIHPTLYLL